MANILSWGKPVIYIAPITTVNPAAAGWLAEFTPVEDSATLATEAGDTLEAPIEGGELEGKKTKASKYTFSYEVRQMDDRTMKIEDVNGVVESEYSLQLIPENATAKGFIIDRSSVAVEDTWSAKDGAKKKFTFTALVPTTGNMVKWGVQTSKVE